MRLVFILPLVLAACQSAPDSGTGGSGASGLGAASVEDLPDPSMIEDVSVDQTTELLADGVRSMSPSVAIQTIDLWTERLNTASVDGAGDVREDLDQLSELLQSSPLDGRSIGLQLKELAESTAAVPDSARQLPRLVSALRAAGRQLAPDSTAVGAERESVQ